MGTTLARPTDVGFTAVLSFADPAAVSRRSSTGAMTSWVLRDTRLRRMAPAPTPRPSRTTTPGQDRQELLHAGSPTSSYGRKIGAADRSQPTPAAAPGRRPACRSPPRGPGAAPPSAGCGRSSRRRRRVPPTPRQRRGLPPGRPARPAHPGRAGRAKLHGSSSGSITASSSASSARSTTRSAREGTSSRAVPRQAWRCRPAPAGRA